LDSFSFEVLFSGFSAKHSAVAKKQSATINPVIFVFMRLIELDFHFPSTFLFPQATYLDCRRTPSHGKRFIVPADENLIAFPKLESAIPSLSLSF
jgi:hypothetical protein